MALGTISGTTSLASGMIVECYSGASSANTAVTISSNTLRAFKLLHVDVVYSGAPTQTGVTVVLNSKVGATYDTTLATGTANATNTVYVPEGGEMWFLPGDVIDVTAPAGGGSLTAQISIYVEHG